MSKVIILEELDFEWDTKDINKVLILWHEGVGIKKIAEFVGRSTEETFLLLMDQAKKGKIKERENFIWGSKDNGNKGEGRNSSKVV
jgi:hypothetical protein